MINLKILMKEVIFSKNLLNNMPKDTINAEKLKDYWRNIDKNILFSFLSLFFLGIFFSFSSTSSLAGGKIEQRLLSLFL